MATTSKVKSRIKIKPGASKSTPGKVSKSTPGKVETKKVKVTGTSGKGVDKAPPSKKEKKPVETVKTSSESKTKKLMLLVSQVQQLEQRVVKTESSLTNINQLLSKLTTFLENRLAKLDHAMEEFTTKLSDVEAANLEKVESAIKDMNVVKDVAYDLKDQIFDIRAEMKAKKVTITTKASPPKAVTPKTPTKKEPPKNVKTKSETNK